jgi:hypothetical protein
VRYEFPLSTLQLMFCAGIYRQSNEHGKQRWHAAGRGYETAAIA